MRTFPFLSIAFSLMVLTACGSVPSSATITFIGIAEGTLQTDVQLLKFSDMFERKNQSLIGAVSLSEPMDGATVVGTWFSPDDRSMPLGRTTILLQSGATLARFSFANSKNWEASPYMLDVRLQAPERKSITKEVASGSVHFFIGMEKGQIKEYSKNYLVSQERERVKTSQQQAKDQADQVLLNRAQEFLRAPSAVLAASKDLTDDGKPESLFVDTHDLPADASAPASLIYSAAVLEFALMDSSGSVLVSLTANGLKIGDRLIIHPSASPVVLTILQSSIISMTWNHRGKECSLDLLPEQHSWIVRPMNNDGACDAALSH
ncbi:MAG: hypothetical protein WCG83_05540 [Candidatus Peregrinibacteria bacterium]